jgi:predicted anti-sigma-YlaC factor YlaD
MCEDVRVAMSARLDGEEPGLAPEEIDSHLAGCAECTTWLAEAERLPRPALTAPDLTAPDLTGRIMAAVAADPVIAADAARRQAAAEARGRHQVLRIAVAAAAVVQLALALPTLVGAFLSSELGPHAGREMASFDIAVAVGFLVAAIRPAKASALVPVALALVLCLFATAAVDVARNTTGLGQETGHLIVLLQAGALWALGRSGQRPGQAPVRVTA